MLCTKPNEVGLYLCREDSVFTSLEAIDLTFSVSPNASTPEAKKGLETVLCGLGWGPVVWEQEPELTGRYRAATPKID